MEQVSRSYSREKGVGFNGVLLEHVLVSDKGNKINLGSAPRLGSEIQGYGVRTADILDAAGVEIIGVDE